MLRPASTDLDELKKISSAEEKTLCAILKTLNTTESNSPAREEMNKLLSRYSLKSLYALSENSAELKIVLDTDSQLNKSWSDRLRKLEKPYQVIESVDKALSVSLFSQLMGTYLLAEFNKNPNYEDASVLAILNKACDLGIFDALIQRINYYVTLISQKSLNKMNYSDHQTIKDIILQDNVTVRNLYWSIGCLDSSIILFNLINYYYSLPGYQLDVGRFFSSAKVNKFSWVDNYGNPNRPDPIEILEVAIENLYMALLLNRFPQSISIIEQISHGKELMAKYEDSFVGIDELQKMVYEKLVSLGIPLVDSFSGNALKKAREMVMSHHPEFGLRS